MSRGTVLLCDESRSPILPGPWKWPERLWEVVSLCPNMCQLVLTLSNGLWEKGVRISLGQEEAGPQYFSQRWEKILGI